MRERLLFFELVNLHESRSPKKYKTGRPNMTLLAGARGPVPSDNTKKISIFPY